MMKIKIIDISHVRVRSGCERKTNAQRIKPRLTDVFFFKYSARYSG